MDGPPGHMAVSFPTRSDNRSNVASQSTICSFLMHTHSLSCYTQCQTPVLLFIYVPLYHMDALKAEAVRGEWPSTHHTRTAPSLASRPAVVACAFVHTEGVVCFTPTVVGRHTNTEQWNSPLHQRSLRLAFPPPLKNSVTPGSMSSSYWASPREAALRMDGGFGTDQRRY